MWSDEQLNDAVQVLWNASENGELAKVTDKEQKEVEEYVVANDVAYTDPLYLKALEKLLSQKRLESAGKQADRQIFRRAEGGGCCGDKAHSSN
jgi:hypothetical protein